MCFGKSIEKILENKVHSEEWFSAKTNIEFLRYKVKVISIIYLSYWQCVRMSLWNFFISTTTVTQQYIYLV